ncbi:MAG: hypothetical protein RMM07_11865, partial [Anaerolineae bacterium]|nr:hypothetical protein [Anaerolineae bacterium]
MDGTGTSFLTVEEARSNGVLDDDAAVAFYSRVSPTLGSPSQDAGQIGWVRDQPSLRCSCPQTQVK